MIGHLWVSRGRAQAAAESVDGSVAFSPSTGEYLVRKVRDNMVWYLMPDGRGWFTDGEFVQHSVWRAE